ncbi:M16 family metallopeptidase [Leifsonia xyli]|uniref:M16 family metallopeptidase n=1 Tax=Leifsonia xyli TaxID=1575 RepID=UPI003D679AF1
MNRSTTVDALTDGPRLISDYVPERAVQAIEIRVSAGFADDPVDRPGVAHLLEHLTLRRGVEQASQNATAAMLNRRGLQPTAFTARDFTSFSVLAPKDDAAEALHGLWEMLRRPDFAEEAVRAERKIISAEQTAQAADPVRTLMHVAESRMYGFPAPSSTSADELSADDALVFWRRHYHSSNMVICTSGPVRHIHHDYASPVPVSVSSGALSEDDVRTAQSRPERLHVRACDPRTPLTHLLVSFPVSTASLRERAVANVLAAALGAGFSSLLIRKLRVERQLCYSPRAFFTGYGPSGSVTAVASAPRATEAPTEAVLAHAMRDLSRDPLLESSVDAAKCHLRTGTILAFDDLAKRAAGIASAWQRGHAWDHAAILQSIDDVTTDEIRKLASKLAALPRHDIEIAHPSNP